MQAQTASKPQGKRKPISAVHAMMGMLEVQRDARKLNLILAHPDIHAWVAPRSDTALDMAEAIADPRVICLLGKHGGVLFHQHQPGLYEAHTQILPEGRGAWGLDCVRACLMWMFTRADAMEIITRCPKGNLAATALARAVGGTRILTNANGWIKDGVPIPADYYSLKVEDWMRLAPGLEERGAWFHERLEAELATFDRAPHRHPDDTVHDRYVGAACEMFFGGQPAKARVLYNRFAVMAGYLPLEIVNMSPLAVDISSALLVMGDGDFRVVSVAPLH